MHLIGQGIGKHLYDLVTVSMNKNYNSCRALRYEPTDEEQEASSINSAKWPYTFYIPKATLIGLGALVGDSAVNIPATFTEKWVNPISDLSGGNRAVDWIGFLLRMLPAVFVPYFVQEATKKPVLALIRACELCLQWELTAVDLQVIKR